MCLTIRVEINGIRGDRIEVTARESSSAEGLVVTVASQGTKKAPATLLIADQPRSCACGLLADEADWNAETWAMRPDMLPRLTWTLERLGAHARDGLTIAAIWQGERIGKEETVSLRELLNIARSSMLGTRTRYKVL